MTRFFWTDGRFGWPFVIAVVYITVCVLGADLAWRLWDGPFIKLALPAAGAAGFVGIVLLLLYRGHLRSSKASG